MKHFFGVGVFFLMCSIFNWGAANAYLRVSPLEVERANQHNFALQAATLGPIGTYALVREGYAKYGWLLW